VGSYVELNDTLQITTEQGFPADRLVLSQHVEAPYRASDFENEEFSFSGKPGARVFHTPPCRVFLAHNIDGRWLYWGHVSITEQTIHSDSDTTSGKFVITKIYDPAHQRAMSTLEVEPGKEFLFPELPVVT
jgi:hypothetical protein